MVPLLECSADAEGLAREVSGFERQIPDSLAMRSFGMLKYDGDSITVCVTLCGLRDIKAYPHCLTA